MRYFSTSETAKQWNISARRVAKLASEGKIKGASLVGNNWMIPETASKPEDGRKKTGSSVDGDRYVFPDLIFGISTKDDPDNLPPDEKQLYGGILHLCKTDFEEGIRILQKLLQSTDRECLLIGASYYLFGAYIVEWQFDKAVEMLDIFYKEIATAKQHKEELMFMKQQVDSYLNGYTSISNPFDIDLDTHYSKGFLPFLAEENVFSDLCSFYTDSPRSSIASHEIICMNLENQGYFYAALYIHFHIAVMYSLVQNTKKREQHLKKAFDMALKYECFSGLAFYLWLYPDFIPFLRKNYPPETVDMLLNTSNRRMETSKAFLKYSAGSEILQILTREDHRLICLARSGYSIPQMAELEKVSTSTIKQWLGKLYKKMGVKTKKELIEKYHRELLDLGTQ